MTDRRAQQAGEDGIGPVELAVALLASLLLTAFWLGLTTRNDLNYHLFPAAIAAAPVLVLNLIRGAAPARTASLLLTAIGLGLVLGGWLVLEALEEAPAATFIGGQPGGAMAEAAVLAVAGAALGRRLFVDRGADGK